MIHDFCDPGMIRARREYALTFLVMTPDPSVIDTLCAVRASLAKFIELPKLAKLKRKANVSKV